MAQAQKISHPTTDPKLPSFVHPHLLDVLEDLETVRDCWDLLRGVKGKYLPKEPREPKRAYDGRVARSKYPGFYREGIIGFAGALSRWNLIAAPDSFERFKNNIDGEGASLKAFLLWSDAMVLRDNGCLLMVDMPRETVESRADQRAIGGRAVLRMAERSEVLNWRTTKVGGREIPIAVTVREFHEVEDEDYGVKIEPRYRVMKGGEWQLVRIEGSGRDRKVVVEDKGEFLDAKRRRLLSPPVVWYPAGPGQGFGRGNVELLSLALLSLAYFRKDSDQEELLHRCALPVGVRKGMPMETGADGQPRSAPLEIGPNSIVDIPNPSGSFEWAEINGSSLELRQKSLEHLEKLMDRQTLAFLMSGSASDRTATEAILASAQLTASLAGVAEAKTSTMQSVMALWAEMTGDLLPANAGIEMEKGLVDKPIEVEMLREAREWFNQGLARRVTATSLWARAGLLPQGVTAEDEANALDQQERSKFGDVGARTPGVNDQAAWDMVPPSDNLPGGQQQGQGNQQAA